MSEETRAALEGPIVIGSSLVLGMLVCSLFDLPFGIGFLIAVLAVAAYGIYKLMQKQAEEAAKEQAAQEVDRMYASGNWMPNLNELQTEFAHYNIHDVDSNANFQRAQLILSMYMSKCGVPEKYHSIYNTKDRISKYVTEIEVKIQKEKEEKIAREKRILLDNLRKDEAIYKKQHTQYAELIGREKSIRYCQDQIDEWNKRIQQYQKQAQTVRNAGNTLYETTRERESNWALPGGIASGIAGGAAGLAVAADVERKNEQIRGRNDNLASSIAVAMDAKSTDIYREIVRAEDSVKHWEKQLNKSKLLLVESMDEKVLLKKLSPKVLHIENSQTGAVKLEIELRKTPDFTICENVSAVVDGSIRIILKADGKKVGTAMCTLDLSGSYRKQTMICICTDISKQEDDYQVSFEPYHLWAVEKC